MYDLYQFKLRYFGGKLAHRVTSALSITAYNVILPFLFAFISKILQLKKQFIKIVVAINNSLNNADQWVLNF